MDSQADLGEEAAQAVTLGLSALYTTDHCDLIDENGQRVYDLDWAPILEQHQRVSAAYADRLKLRLGLELGSAQCDPECARRILAGAPLDLVIGSVHNMDLSAGGIDFYFLPYHTQGDCYAALDNYFASLEQLSALPDCYDVLGHIIYPLRYMTGAVGAPISLERYQDQLRDIFTAAVNADRGIEVNTYCGRTLEDWLPILRLYRACGGEIVTTGSDAHAPENIGRGIQEAQELLKAAGFRYQAVYQRRVPQFVKL
jgi:histidinol-phosphatase (PHP family)